MDIDKLEIVGHTEDGITLFLYDGLIASRLTLNALLIEGKIK